MAGHSKWANIQHRKKAQDKKRSKIFTRLIRDLTVAAREGGSDLDSNSRLRLAVDKANGANMPKDVLERAIKRGAGELDDVVVDEIWYEGYGPAGVAVMVECLTDNRNRTVAEVRHAFSKCGGNLGTSGSVSYLFNKQGILSFPEGTDEDKLMEVAIEAGADDVVIQDDGRIEVITAPDQFTEVLTILSEQGLTTEDAEVMQIPTTTVDCDAETAEKVVRLIDMLDDLDDVQNVFANVNLPQEAE